MAASGDLRAAREALTDAADTFDALGDLQYAAAAWHGIARLGYAEPAAERLCGLTASMDGPFPAARLAHARALSTRDAEALTVAGHEFAALGANLYAAEAHAEAAVLQRRAGESREAAASARRADLLASRCEDARTPALLGLDVRARLTRAEIETAHLAAAGHSNREIAKLLTVSLRTVENRLYKIYEKLGVTSRDALADAIHDL
jgi:DNA-binding NarL/FixJ family response regulator